MKYTYNFVKILIFYLLLLFFLSNCTSNKFVFTNNTKHTTKKEREMLEQCIRSNKNSLLEKGFRIVKNNKDKRYYLGTIYDNYITPFEINCTNIDFIFNDSLVTKSYEKIVVFTYNQNNIPKEINHGINNKEGSYHSDYCKFFKNGKLQKCFYLKTLIEIDSITGKLQKNHLW